MAKFTVKYLISKRRKSGAYAWYWQPNKALRKGGWKIQPLGNTPSAVPTPEILAAAGDINLQVDQWRAGILDKPATERPGTIDAIIKAYKASKYFKSLADKTQRDYSYNLDIVSQWAGDTLAIAINAQMVQDLYDGICEKKPRKAAYIIQVLRLLYNFANDKKVKLVPENFNPAAKPEISYKAKKGKLWSPEAITAFVKTADKMGHFSIGTAVMINEWIGQRKGDIIALKMKAFNNDILEFVQSKTGAEIQLPLDALPAEILNRIAEQDRRNHARKNPSDIFIQMESGEPYSSDWFAHKVKEIRDAGAKDEPSLAGMIFKNLRHTAVTRLAEAECTIPEIASITGHSLETVEVILDTYLIRTRKMAGNALRKRAAAERN